MRFPERLDIVVGVVVVVASIRDGIVPGPALYSKPERTLPHHPVQSARRSVTCLQAVCAGQSPWSIGPWAINLESLLTLNHPEC